jgi:hypothetical protein
VSQVWPTQEFFDRAVEAFESVSDRKKQSVRLGPLTLDLVTSGSFARRKWSTPLAVQPDPSERACATIYAWDDSDEPGRFPAPPWGSEFVYTHRGDVQGHHSDRLELAFNLGSRLLSMWDRERKIGIYWTPEVNTLPGYEWAAPMRTLLHWIGLEHGLQLAHAAVVGKDGRGILLTGRGGSGKSTTALACWNAGWDFVSDDYCWVASDSVTAYPVYHTAKLIPGQSIDLPQWDPDERLSQEKDVFVLPEHSGGRLVASLPLEALLLPCPADVAETRLRPASRRDALAGLSLTTMAQLAGAGSKTMDHLRRVVESMEAFHLDLCHPVSAVPDVLKKVLAR